MTTLEEDDLAHFGVKGMRWGVRKADTSGGTQQKSGMSTKKKVLIGTAVVAGVAATAAILARSGSVSVPTVRSSAQTSAGRKFIEDSRTFEQIKSEMMRDFAKAHEEETRFIKGLLPEYNPRKDPYIPAYELARLRS